MNDGIKDRHAFTPTEWEELNNIRQKHKHNRLIFTDFKFVLFKELPSIALSRASRYIETKIALAIIECCLLPDESEDFDRITMHGDGSMHHFTSKKLI